MDLKRRIFLLCLILPGLGFLSPAQEEAAPDPSVVSEEVAAQEGESREDEEVPAKKENRKLLEARKLVAQLGDESYQVREAATKGLWNLGEEGIEAIREGVGTDDPEISHRARIVLRRILTGITPETSPRIVEMVQRYFDSDPARKKDVFEDLLEAKAYIQMLRIYRFEEDEASRRSCGELVEKAIMPLALMELAEGNLEQAEEILRLAPATIENHRRLSCLLRMQDKLDEEMAIAGLSVDYGEDGKVTEATREVGNFQLALLRSKGRHQEARQLAEKLGRTDAVAVMALLEGDPGPYLKWYMDRPNESVIVRAHAETVLRRWELDHENANRLMNRMAEEAAGEGDERREAMLSLLLNGNLEAGLPLVFRANKDAAFTYYETVEEPGKAVQVFGYTGTPEEKAQWLRKRFDILRKDWSDSEKERYEVLTIASFLHTRGERQEGREIMDELSRIAFAEGRSNWLEFIGRLNDLGGSLYELAFFIASEKLTPESKDRDDLRVVTHLFGEGDSAPRLWRALGEIEPDKQQRIILLGGLYGFVHIEEERLKAFFGRVKEVAADEEHRPQILADLLEAAESRDDATVSIRLLQELMKDDPDEKWEKKLAAYYGYVSDWESSIATLKEILEKEPTNVRYLAHYGSALIRAGRGEEARRPLDAVETFSLDEPIRLLRLAIDVQRSGALAEAEGYWRKLVGTGSPADWYWQTAASYFSKHARHNKQWRVAAAFAEVDAMQYLKGRSTFINPVSFIRKRFIADLYRALALHQEGNTEEAMKLFRSSFEILNGDGILADDYFPLLREAGLVEEHDRNFRIVYQRLGASIEAYPRAHNTYNSAAWMASRACRELPDALKKIEKALSMRPRQAAYLDTMAEVWFARRDREKAVEWSRRAVQESFHGGSSSDAGVGLREQYDRFVSDEFPVP